MIKNAIEESPVGATPSQRPPLDLAGLAGQASTIYLVTALLTWLVLPVSPHEASLAGTVGMGFFAARTIRRHLAGQAEKVGS